MTELHRICARRAELLRELADLDAALGEALGRVEERPADDATLSLAEAAAFMGEPPSTMRRREDCRRAVVSRPNARRLLFSRAELDRIRRDRLARNGIGR